MSVTSTERWAATGSVRRKTRGRRGGRRAVIAAAAASFAAALGMSSSFPARATSKSWIGASDNWSNPSDWSPAGQPANGDTVTLAIWTLTPSRSHPWEAR
jgi:hypothetical protein